MVFAGAEGAVAVAVAVGEGGGVAVAFFPPHAMSSGRTASVAASAGIGIMRSERTIRAFLS
jgi:hypothetical protein